MAFLIASNGIKVCQEEVKKFPLFTLPIIKCVIFDKSKIILNLSSILLRLRTMDFKHNYASILLRLLVVFEL